MTSEKPSPFAASLLFSYVASFLYDGDAPLAERRAQALADTFDEDVGVTELAGLAQRGPWDLLVNATPAGTKGVADALPVPDATVQRARFVFDLVYNPPETPLLRSARNARVPGTSGLEMLLHQAAKAFELWTGKAADLRAMERAAMEALR